VTPMPSNILMRYITGRAETPEDTAAVFDMAPGDLADHAARAQAR